jgi:ribonucleotide reductase alpha subunit
MEVVKRNGNRERVSFDKIIRRIEGVCKRLNLERIDPIEIAKETVQGLYNGITTEELDFFAANKCAEKILDDPEYNKLAAGLCISNLHKNTSSNFLKVSQKLYDNRDAEGNHTPLITREYLDIVNNNIDKISSAIDYSKDYGFDFFAVKTFERAYLIRLKNDHFDHMDKKKKHNLTGEAKMRMKKGKIIERPQHMIMRIALGIHGQDIDSAIETYSLISDHYFTHASPTLFNAGATRPQLSSCFLLGMDDNLNDIFETIADVSKISKWAGGIGIHLNDIRAANSIIRGTNGVSDGIIPLIKVLNEVGRYVNQGGRRNGAIAVYVEPWHADIYEFCDLRKNTGAEELRARDIFLALCVLMNVLV